MNDRAGQTLGGYRLVGLIGRGGMGEVYLAEHVHLRRKYAVKVLPAELVGDRGFVERFYDEARVMAELNHPHIVPVHNMDCVDGVYFLAMEYVAGPDDGKENQKAGGPLSLHDYLRQQPEGRLEPSQAKKWAIQVAEALSYAHERGVVHRDLKPANILIDRHGDVKLTDFGLAKAVGREFRLSQIHQTMQRTLSADRTVAAGSGASRQAQDTLDVAATATPTGSKGSGRHTSSAESILGTYDYMAPEQRGEVGGEIDRRTDIYGFGVLLYRVLTGKRPSNFAKPPSQAAGVSRKWDPITARCLEESPDDRYPSADSLLKDLKRLGSRSRRAVRMFTKTAVILAILGGLGYGGVSGWRWWRGHEAGATAATNSTVASDDDGDSKLAGIRRQAVQAREQSESSRAAATTAAQAASRAEAQADAEGVASVRAAKSRYQNVLSDHDADRLREYGGDAWSKVAEQLRIAEASGEDFDRAAEAYERAASLLTAAAKAAESTWTDAQVAGLLAKARSALGRLPSDHSSLSASHRRQVESALESVDSALKYDPSNTAALSLKQRLESYLGPQVYTAWPFDSREASRRQEQTASALGIPTEQTLDCGNGVKMKLVLIPAGTFVMGSPGDEEDHDDDEGPQRRVTLSEPFYMGATEVTQAQYEAVTGENPSYSKGPKNPVERVSWNDATAFCRKLATKTGRTVRLPTEAEWEYACRGGASTRFCYGDADDKLSDYAWYGSNSDSRTHPIGQKKPNAFGLYDMHGNVWEWCSDWYQDSYRGLSDKDPKGPNTGKYRVLRGGSWIIIPWFCRSAIRDGNSPGLTFYDLGFRVVVAAGRVD